MAHVDTRGMARISIFGIISSSKTLLSFKKLIVRWNPFIDKQAIVSDFITPAKQ